MLQDFYEKVPEVGEWPLPPIPRHANDDCVEISQAELEDQAAQERHSFMSGSSANDDDEEEEEVRGLIGRKFKSNIPRRPFSVDPM